MEKIAANAKAKIEYSITLTLTPNEAKALEAVTQYGANDFLQVFYEKLGRTQLEPYETEIRQLFDSIRLQLRPAITKVEANKKLIEGILEEFK